MNPSSVKYVGPFPFSEAISGVSDVVPSAVPKRSRRASASRSSARCCYSAVTRRCSVAREYFGGLNIKATVDDGFAEQLAKLRP